MVNWFGSLPQSKQIVLVLFMIGGISILDYQTGTELSFAVFYFLPIIAVSWFRSRMTGVIISFLCAASWATADYVGGNVYTTQYIFAFNTFVRLGIFLIISYLIWKLRIGSDLLKQKELSAQKSYDVINTSQIIITLLANNIIDRNSSLWLWIVKQKQDKKPVPKIVESTCEQIGANLSALTEICYGYQPIEKNNIDIDVLVNQIEARLTAVNSKYLSEEHDSKEDMQKIKLPPQFMDDDGVLQNEEFMNAYKILSM